MAGAVDLGGTDVPATPTATLGRLAGRPNSSSRGGRRASQKEGGPCKPDLHPIGLQLEAMTKHCGLGRDNHDDDGDEDDVDISSRRQ